MTDDARPPQSALTAEQIAEIRARADAATGGLWVVVHDGTERSISTTESGRFVCHLNSNMLHYTSDADFIAHARADVPQLLAALEAAEAERDALRTDLAKREPISNAEFARFVTESQEQRERADVLTTENAALREAADAMAARTVQVVDMRGPLKGGGRTIDVECQVCHHMGTGTSKEPPHIEHAADCPVARYRALRGKEG